MIASQVKERWLHQKDELKPVLELASITRDCNSFLNKFEAVFCHQRQKAQAGGWPCTPQAGWWCLSREHWTITPLPCLVPFCPSHTKSSCAPFLPSSPPREKQRVAVSNGSRQEIWGLVYYMLNRALNYWWLLPSLTAFLKRETWANKHVSWKSPYSDRSWQEKNHPGLMTVYQ